MRAARTSPMVFIDGRPLQSMAMWGDLKIADRWPYGCWEMQWNVILKPYQRIPRFATGAIVEARMGSGVRWRGTLGQPDWDTGAMRAFGLARRGEEAMALDVSEATTSVPDVAVDQAIARGVLPWRRRVSLSAVPFAATESTAQLNYVTALLDAWANSEGKRWGVDARGDVYAAEDPTVPSIHVRPGAGELGVSDRNEVARIFGRFEALDGSYQTASVGAGAPEVGMSLFKYGPIDMVKATAVITGIRDRVQAAPGWSNGLTLTADQVTTTGGQRLGLDRVVAGKMARLLGLYDARGRWASTDIVLAGSDWDVTAGMVAVEPVALDDETLAGVTADMGGELA